MSDFKEYLQERFPEMRPISSPPSMFTVNGIGLTVYGNRDGDQETGTYVTTLAFTILFVPIFALRSYRVADAREGGWYFLGIVPLSNLAKAWNCSVLVAILGGIGALGWHQHTKSPAYLAQQHLAAGDAPASSARSAFARGSSTRRIRSCPPTPSRGWPSSGARRRSSRTPSSRISTICGTNGPRTSITSCSWRRTRKRRGP
jgi:hypothetical protein